MLELQIIAYPFIYREIAVSLQDGHENVESLVSSLQQAQERGRNLWPFIDAIFISEPWDMFEKPATIFPDGVQRSLRALLSNSRRLHTLGINNTSETVLDICVDTASDRLLHIEIYDPIFSSLGRVRDLSSLRTLYILTSQVFMQRCELSFDEHAWGLPSLENLRWEEQEIYTKTLLSPIVISFLSKCDFPRLRAVDLCVEVDNRNGPDLLRQFLARHSGIDSLGLAMSIGTYEDALTVPGVNPTHLSVRRCGNAMAYLLNWMPMSVQCLDLPVYFDSRTPTITHKSPLGVLDALVSQPRNVREIHLSLGRRWHSVHWDPKLPELDRREPCLFGRCSTNYADKMRRDELALIKQCALRLQDVGITVYDEDGMTFMDYKE
jgi:hypothetical protein